MWLWLLTLPQGESKHGHVSTGHGWFFWVFFVFFPRPLGNKSLWQHLLGPMSRRAHWIWATSGSYNPYQVFTQLMNTSGPHKAFQCHQQQRSTKITHLYCPTYRHTYVEVAKPAVCSFEVNLKTVQSIDGMAKNDHFHATWWKTQDPTKNNQKNPQCWLAVCSDDLWTIQQLQTFNSLTAEMTVELDGLEWEDHGSGLIWCVERDWHNTMSNICSWWFHIFIGRRLWPFLMPHTILLGLFLIVNWS